MNPPTHLLKNRSGTFGEDPFQMSGNTFRHCQNSDLRLPTCNCLSLGACSMSCVWLDWTSMTSCDHASEHGKIVIYYYFWVHIHMLHLMKCFNIGSSCLWTLHNQSSRFHPETSFWWLRIIVIYDFQWSLFVYFEIFEKAGDRYIGDHHLSLSQFVLSLKFGLL